MLFTNIDILVIFIFFKSGYYIIIWWTISVGPARVSVLLLCVQVELRLKLMPCKLIGLSAPQSTFEHTGMSGPPHKRFVHPSCCCVKLHRVACHWMKWLQLLQLGEDVVAVVDNSCRLTKNCVFPEIIWWSTNSTLRQSLVDDWYLDESFVFSTWCIC